MPLKPRSILITVLVVASSALRAGEPISVHPENPNYFLWRGQATALISATEHYGSAIIPDFNYVRYLDTLAADGLNATMLMSGAFIEGGLGNDSLQPPAGKALIPWARSEEPGYVYGGNKFDLSRFDEEYFMRLRSIVQEANQRGVVVWYVFFTPYFDDHKWKASPWNPTNYAHGPGPVDRATLFTLDRHGGFLDVQEKLIRRVVEELRDADTHVTMNLPVVLAGGGFKHGQHLAFDTERNYPLPNLFVSMLQRMDIEADRFASSTGTMRGLELA